MTTRTLFIFCLGLISVNVYSMERSTTFKEWVKKDTFYKQVKLCLNMKKMIPAGDSGTYHAHNLNRKQLDKLDNCNKIIEQFLDEVCKTEEYTPIND